jgi:pimeloyl-ACP methyl ester carboxylesterase
MNRRRSRWAVGVVAVVALVCAGCSTSPSRPAGRGTGAPAVGATGAGRLARFDRQRLQWRPCGGFQCATLRVPLDYAHPNGRTIGLAVIREPASDPRERIGALVMNPGGPGASGVQFLRQAAGAFPAVIRARFDLVSFDPRGVGASAPVHCLSGAQLTAYLAANPVPTTAAQRATAVALAKEFAAGCRRYSGALLPFVGTIDVARDMDVLRAALGEPRLTYLGFSYGTFLGALYAQLFPRRIRAMVLDGAVDPRLTSMRLAQVQADGFQKDLRDFLSWCVRQPGCPLGRTVASASRGLSRLQSAVLRHPLPAGGYGTLASGDFLAGLAAGLYDPATGWPDLLDGLRSAASGDGVPLLVLADELEGHTPGGGWSNELEANVAVNCIDRPNPTRVSTYAAAAAKAARTAPVFGAANVWSDLVCAYWPVPAVTRPHPVHAAGAPPILVVGTSGDPATPYAWAKALAGQLRSGRLLTYVGDGHTAYLRSGCIDRYVDAYLINRSVPAAGTTCS